MTAAIGGEELMTVFAQAAPLAAAAQEISNDWRWVLSTTVQAPRGPLHTPRYVGSQNCSTSTAFQAGASWLTQAMPAMMAGS